MDVSADQFSHEAVKITQEIAEALFVSFDFEFSGIAGRNPNRGGKPTLRELYGETKAAAERYQILQVGVTVVKEDLKTGRYVVRPYNFNLSPLPAVKERVLTRDWSSNSGGTFNLPQTCHLLTLAAVSFLSRNGFQFDTPIKAGVHYLSRKEEQIIRARMINELTSKSTIPDMEFQPEDQALIDHIRGSVREWLAQPPTTREEFLNIPSEAAGVPHTLNRYQVRLTHQVVRNEFVGLQTTGMGHFVRITSPSEKEKISAQVAIAQDREKMISQAVGFRWIIEALVGGNIGGMPEEYLAANLQVDQGQSLEQFVAKLQEKLRKRKRVVIGHNCFTDLVYLYQCFIGDLPDALEDFVEEIHALFPVIMDTKHIASLGSKRWGNTSLEDVEKELRAEQYPIIETPPEYTAYTGVSSYHEAGYDSLLTANIAIRLSAKMEREEKYQEKIKSDGFESMQPAFDADDPGYITASHSRASSVDNLDLTEEVKTPTTAIKTSFDPSVKFPAIKPDVVAVKESAGLRKDKNEVKKLKKQLANTNIYSILESDTETKMPGQEDDLISFSDSDDEELAPQGLHILAKVKKGELIPRWNAEFWKLFGNKLQVNGSKEGVCKLR